jgi:N-methylhydantoinase A
VLSANGTIHVATDVGGTFTDLVSFVTDPDTGAQDVVTAKAATTPPNFERGVMDVLRKGGVPLSDVAVLAHGTTVVINALTERRGVTVGLVTTEGFRDSLEIARGNRPDYFNLDYVKPAPFVPRYLRREVPERITNRGEVRRPLDLDGLPAVLEDFRREGVEAIAVCLLNAYVDPTHERAVLDRVREVLPQVPAVASHEITREWREYERTSTTVLCAYVQPVGERYLGRLADGVRDAGFTGQLYVMQSNCGIDSVERTQRVPITMVESGPASGVWAAAELGNLIGDRNVLALDIGGTTAKCSLVVDGRVRVMTDYWIGRTRREAGYPIMVPVVDLVEIGNGGGSIAWVDDFDKLHVGPLSAGADPGPAAYGHGGIEATTTDANLALGRINPEFFCGGEFDADMEAVAIALDRLASKLGIGRVESARGIVRIANNNMVNALKLVSVNRGYDPRDFTLVAFGGAGGLHAIELAAELAIRRVVIPRAADVFSAWGMLMSDLRRDFFVTRFVPLDDSGAAQLDELLAEVASTAHTQFAGEGVAAGNVRLLRHGTMRYENQEHGVEVPLPDGPIDAAAMAVIRETFRADYEREYTYRLDAPIELVGVHLVAIAEVGKLAPAELPRTGRTLDRARKTRREVDFVAGGVHLADVFAGELLEPGASFAGPAIVETAGSTTVVHPGWSASVDAYGNLVLSVAP